MCEALEVNRSGYYAHKSGSSMLRKTEDERLTTLIIESFEASRQNYGTQRIQRDLREWGETVSRRRRLGVQNYQEIQSHHELKA